MDEHYASRVCSLPRTVLQQHVLPLWEAEDRKTLRQTAAEFRFLMNGEVKAVSMQPAHMQAVVLTSLLKRHPSFCTLTLSDAAPHAVTDDLLASFLLTGSGAETQQALQNVYEVDMKCCSGVSQAGLRQLVECLFNIQTFAAPRWIDPVGVTVLQGFKNLSRLDLGDSSIDILSVDDASLASLPVTLTVLRLERCVSITPLGLAAMAAKLPSLLSLSLDGLQISRATLAALQPLSATLMHASLQRCRLSDTHRQVHAPPGGPCILDAMHTLTRLHSFSLANTHVSVAEKAALARLATSVSGLKVLDLSGQELDEQAMLCVASHLKLEQLSFGNLNIRSRPAEASFQCLQRMSFGGAFCNKGLPLLLPLPVLADLTLTGIETVTDGTMAQVAQQSGLTRLGLSGGFHLGRRGLLSLVALTSLSHLSISRCPGISHADVDQLRTAHSAAIHGGPMTACMQQPDAEPDVWSQHLPGSAAAPGNPGDSSRTAEGGLGVPRVESLSAMQRIASLNAMPRVDSMTSLPCMESLAIAGDASRQRMWAAGAGGCMMQVTLTPAMDHQATA